VDDSFTFGDRGQMLLPLRLDFPAATGLRDALLARSGADLVIDAGKVAHLGGLCLQVLLAARDHWGRTGHRLLVTPRSAAFAAALDTFGIPPGMLESGGLA